MSIQSPVSLTAQSRGDCREIAFENGENIKSEKGERERKRYEEKERFTVAFSCVHPGAKSAADIYLISATNYKVRKRKGETREKLKDRDRDK